MQVQSCPCGTSNPYINCCEPFHQGTPAPTPEQLMRSRYSAYVLHLPDYLLQTWHPNTRPQQLDLHDTPDWASLQVVSSSQNNAKGKVHFCAFYRQGQGLGCLEERSDFVREDGRWYYLSGRLR